MNMKHASLPRFLTAIAILLTSQYGHGDSSEQCPPTENLWARYQLSDVTDGHPSSSTSVTLVRSPDQVAYRYQATAITELWEQTPGGRLRLVRNFDQHRRGIEYQPVEIKGSHDWGTKQHLLSRQLRDELKLVSVSGSRCDRIEHYQGSREHQTFSLDWHTRLQLPQVFVVEEQQGKKRQRWELVEVTTEETRVAGVFDSLSHYQTTDYADVGDNESDPFLMKMINLGFVEHGNQGFYDADGESLDGGHQH